MVHNMYYIITLSTYFRSSEFAIVNCYYQTVEYRKKCFGIDFEKSYEIANDEAVISVQTIPTVVIGSFRIERDAKVKRLILIQEENYIHIEVKYSKEEYKWEYILANSDL